MCLLTLLQTILIVSQQKISGKGVSGATVKAYIGTKQIGNSATVNSSGIYNITIPAQSANTKITVKISKSGYTNAQKV